jgi:hypothetical protein
VPHAILDRDRTPAGSTASSDATTQALRLREGLTFDAWVRAGRQISKMSSASVWWLGDWLLYGQQAFGQRYRSAVEMTGFDYKTLRNYAWVARKFEVSRRRDTLSFQHHAEVASLPEPVQDLWLSRAERMRWSRNELRRQLATARNDGDGSRAPTSVVVRIEIAEQREQRWREAARTAGQELTGWIAAAVDDAAEQALTAASPPGRGARQSRFRVRSRDVA